MLSLGLCAVMLLLPAVASTAAASEGQPPTLLQVMFSGGPLGTVIMVVLIGLSIAAVALALDGLRNIRRAAMIPPQLADEVFNLVSAGDLPLATAACQSQPSFFADVLAQGLAAAEEGWSAAQKALEDGAAEQAARMFRRIEYLSVIGNLAPLVGLLGTVTGLLLAFRHVANTAGSAAAAMRAESIYPALIPTAVGLVIAVFSLVAFALFRSRLDQLVAEAAHAAEDALAPLKQRKGPPITQPPPPPEAK